MAVLTVEASSPSTVNMAWFSSTFRWTLCHWPSLRLEPAGHDQTWVLKLRKSMERRAELTWGNVDTRVLGLRQGHVDNDLALRQAHLHPAVSQRGEHQQPAGVPRPEGQTDRQSVTVALTRQFQKRRRVEKDGEGVGFGTGERQVALQWTGERERQRRRYTN